MNCPSCMNTELVVTNRSGIEIDLCPACRGLWLDRGELDKIVARSAKPDPDDDEDSDDEPRRRHRDGLPDPRSHRRSWWAELFD